MCGIAGIVFKTTDHPNWTTSVVNDMLDTMHYRGPDGRQIFIKEELAIGHLRLSIIDIKNGSQPMFSEDRKHVIIFNGEIYNFLELRQILVRKGYQFKTNSDTEVLLNMYLEFGKDMLGFLNGMFAFFIYNLEEKKGFAARDHFGIKPFYFIQKNDFFAFSSEIKALFKIPGISKSVNSEQVHEYLKFQFSLSNQTLFEGIEKLMPAHFICIENGQIVQNKKYWTMDYTIDDTKNEDEYSDELLVALNNSISVQMRSDVPIGVYLSGGIDSSLVAILASKQTPDSIHCFTGAFHESLKYDESVFAKIVTNQIKGEQKIIYPTHKDFEDNFERLIYLMDEPAAGPGLFSQFMVSKLASCDVKVVLGGQGGDEMFGGYMRYNIAYLEECIKGAIFESSEEGNHIVTLENIIESLPSLKGYIPMLKQQFSRGLFEPMDRRYFNLIDRSQSAEKYYNSDFLATINSDAIFANFQSIFNNSGSNSLFNKMTSFDLQTFLPSLLHVEDRVSMANGIESRVPLLDKNIAELAAKMPPTMKFKGGKNKHIFVKAIHNLLPKEILNRKEKMGFPTPVNEWISGPSKSFALDILTSKKARERGVLNIPLIEKQISLEGNFTRDTWGALCLETWFQQHID